MDITNLNIDIKLFKSKDLLAKYLDHEGFGENNQEIIFENFEGSIWSKTTDGQYALYINVLKTLEDYSLIFDR